MSSQYDRYLPEKLKHGYLFLGRKTLLILNVVASAVLLPLGIWLFLNNSVLNETLLDYTECVSSGPQFTAASGAGISQWKFENGICTLRFPVQQTITERVHMYIRITNMYQNHRLYVKSLDPDQLLGKMYSSASDFPTAAQSTTNCGFLQYANCSEAQKFTFTNGLTHAENNPDCLGVRSQVSLNAVEGAQYYPCGLIANSMFSDTIGSPKCLDSTCRIPSISFSETGIAWPEDAALYNPTSWITSAEKASIPTRLIPPPQWRTGFNDLYKNGYYANDTSTNLPDLKKWERFQVWMRKAGLPTFRKLWGRSDDTMDAGSWELDILYRISISKSGWDCKRFGGTKSVVFSEVGVLGPRNSFLSILFLVTGGFTLVSALLISVVQPRYICFGLL